MGTGWHWWKRLWSGSASGPRLIGRPTGWLWARLRGAPVRTVILRFKHRSKIFTFTRCAGIFGRCSEHEEPGGAATRSGPGSLRVGRIYLPTPRAVGRERTVIDRSPGLHRRAEATTLRTQGRQAQRRTGRATPATERRCEGASRTASAAAPRGAGTGAEAQRQRKASTSSSSPASHPGAIGSPKGRAGAAQNLLR